MELDELSNSREIVRCEDVLARLGLFVRQVIDQSEASELLTRLGATTNDTNSGGPYVTKWLDPRRNQLTSESSFWLFLFDQPDGRGNVVGKTGNRLDRTGFEPFSKFAPRMVRNLHQEDGADVDPRRFSSAADDIFGDLVYCGDTYIHPDFQDRYATPAMISLNYLLIYQKWRIPDWTLCYVRPKDGGRWRWTNRYWDWYKDAADFSHPPSSPIRGLWFGMLDQRGFMNEMKDAQNFASLAMSGMSPQQLPMDVQDRAFETGRLARSSS